ncbi:MAG: nitronate monooxygenase [Alphaproteobacteria bacterium]|nr:nitronate monooxygenase [Alphaproteobacteria bacterium]
MQKYNSIILSGREVLPIIEGGKGVSVSTGATSGAFAAAGGVGTTSGVNPDSYDENGKVIPQLYYTKSRKDKQQELLKYAIDGGIAQAKIAHDISGGNGAIHMNVLWEMGGCEPILEGIFSGAKGLIHGVACGAGMPFRLAELSAKHGVYIYPIVSSGRAFNALWKRAYKNYAEWLGGVVYEDPWLAGGHNGLSNNESPDEPQKPYGRVVELRKVMTKCGLAETPIIMAGGVWCLSDWDDWFNNPEIGPIAFQLGTRPMVTKESPISDEWKKLFTTLKDGDVLLQKFSPTGFYSSAIKNDFLNEMIERSERQVSFTKEADAEHKEAFEKVFLRADGIARAKSWIEQGYIKTMKTPDDTLIFVTEEKAKEIKADQAACVGCLSHCMFSSFAQGEKGTIGRIPDPRSFCIQKTLQSIAHGGDINNELLFAGHNAYRFGTDPLYANGNIPTTAELIAALMAGK